MTDITSARLTAHHLIGESFPDAVDAVRWFGAVQSQDYGGAKWALGQRTRSATDVSLDRLFDAGAILRTHVLRPTWHFVLPEDIRWLLALTAPRIRAGLAGRYRDLEIDGGVVLAADRAFGRALADGQPRTRQQLGDALRLAGIAPDGQRLPHLLMAAELDGVLTSGPRRGGRHTYALLDERAPGGRVLEREAAIAELCRRYFRSHGPAEPRDFAWWSGLTVTEARSGIEGAGNLELVAGERVDLWIDGPMEGNAHPSGTAHLLPNFDEYTVGYRDRSHALHPDIPFDPSLFAFSSVLANVLTIDGRVRGSWRRVAHRGRLRLEGRLLRELEPGERRALEEAVSRLGRFLERPVDLDFQPAPQLRPLTSGECGWKA